MSFLRPILYTVLQGNLGIFENKGTSYWNFAPNSGLGKFRHSVSIVEACYQLSSRKVDAQGVINWTVVGQLYSQIPLPGSADFARDPRRPNGLCRRPGYKLIIPPNSDA